MRARHNWRDSVVPDHNFIGDDFDRLRKYLDENVDHGKREDRVYYVSRFAPIKLISALAPPLILGVLLGAGTLISLFWHITQLESIWWWISLVLGGSTVLAGFAAFLAKVNWQVRYIMVTNYGVALIVEPRPWMFWLITDEDELGLSNITDVRYSQNVVGRWFGFGSVTLINNRPDKKFEPMAPIRDPKLLRDIVNGARMPFQLTTLPGLTSLQQQEITHPTAANLYRRRGHDMRE